MERETQYDRQQEVQEELRYNRKLAREIDATWNLLTTDCCPWDLKSQDYKLDLAWWINQKSLDWALVEELLKKSYRAQPPDDVFIGSEKLYELVAVYPSALPNAIPNGGGLYIFTQVGSESILKIGQTGDFKVRMKQHLRYTESRGDYQHEVVNHCRKIRTNPDSWPAYIRENQITLLFLPIPCDNEFLREALEHELRQWLTTEMD